MVSSNQNQASGNHSKQNQERPTRRQKSRALAMATLELVRANVPRRGIRPGTHRIFYDQTNQGYGWLLPGWVAEERVMPVSGRTYRVRSHLYAYFFMCYI